jgi:cell division protein FtsQ
MKEAWNIVSWAFGFILIISLFSFSEDSQNRARFAGLEIEVEDGENYHLITREEVVDLIYREYPFLDSLFCKEINKNLLEESLDNHPSIAKAEVYSTLYGTLWVKISQKRPVFRVQHSERAYYVDASGGVMPLSPHYSAQVPLVTGKISEETQRRIYDFLIDLIDDDFYRDFFHGIEVSEEGVWTLYPAIAEHRVILGEPEEITDKLQRLRTFYERTRETPLINEFKTLNLSFNGQVVCSKK